jgi:sulfoxide reductase catalytic subunit YedY
LARFVVPSRREQVKWSAAIKSVESFEHLGAGQGGYNEDREFYGYRMPI